jgi:hypothetical protein
MRTNEITIEETKFFDENPISFRSDPDIVGGLRK